MIQSPILFDSKMYSLNNNNNAAAIVAPAVQPASASSDPVVIYNSVLPITISPPAKEAYIQQTNIKLSQYQQGANRMLYLQLSQELDPYFLYESELSEADFGLIRKEQKLMVDFTSFPAEIIRLLDQCKKQSETNFFIKFDISCNYDQINTVSNFRINWLLASKEIEYLRLSMRSATDQQLKKFLAEQLLSCKASLATANSQLLAQNSENKSIFEKNQGLEAEISRQNTLQTEQFNILQARYLNELTVEKENHMLALQSSQNSHENQQKALVNDYKTLQTSSAAEKLQLFEELKALRERFSALQYDFDSLSAQNQRKLQECNEMQGENSALKASVLELERCSHENDKIIQHQQLKLAALEQEKLDNEKFLNSQLNMIESEKRANSAQKEQNLGLKTALSEAQTQLQQCSAEISRGNQFITKLGAKINNFSKKITAKKAEIEQKAAKIGELSTENEGLRRKLEEFERNQKEFARENSKKELIIGELSEESKENQQKIKELMETINFLNQQSNKTLSTFTTAYNSALPPLSTANLAPKPSNFYGNQQNSYAPLPNYSSLAQNLPLNDITTKSFSVSNAENGTAQQNSAPSLGNNLYLSRYSNLSAATKAGLAENSLFSPVSINSTMKNYQLNSTGASIASTNTGSIANSAEKSSYFPGSSMKSPLSSLSSPIPVNLSGENSSQLGGVSPLGAVGGATGHFHAAIKFYDENDQINFTNNGAPHIGATTTSAIHVR
jgi:spindle assembly abnormal protein 6